MNIYVVIGKYSQDYISGLIFKPQDRKKASLTMMKKAGVEWAEGNSYLHVNHPNFDFIGTIYCDDENSLKASMDMMRATGNFKEINFFKAWLPEDYINISKKASDLVGTFAAPSDFEENK